MSIKSDRWIRRMAEQHRMIEPFAPNQVRKDESGSSVISYGTSSYGYDIRCANEFKIFTNINSAIVDPKNFDANSFVDLKADVCIIPPNSFALARTVEYLRIPRNVLTICLGKCLTGDTRVLDANSGAYRPITEFGWGDKTLSLHADGLAPATVSALHIQGERPVFELITDRGRRIRATANHPLRRPGGWTTLADLRANDHIAVAGELSVFGSRPLVVPAATALGLWFGAKGGAIEDTALNALRREACAAIGCEEGAPAPRWLAELGIDPAAGPPSIPERVFQAPRESVRHFLSALFSAAAVGNRVPSYAAGSWRLADDLHHLLLRFGVSAHLRSDAEGSGTYRVSIDEPSERLRFAERIGCVPGSLAERLLADGVVRAISNAPASGALAVAITPEATHASGLAWERVSSIRPVGVEPVYDITVPSVHNFIANGLIVHNSTYARCGIIVNVTPLEPEWEGHVTLEFSNTTPLPARIYAHEGVAQILFFESDEVCESSYRDRKGKYQGQRGVTLPKP